MATPGMDQRAARPSGPKSRSRSHHRAVVTLVSASRLPVLSCWRQRGRVSLGVVAASIGLVVGCGQQPGTEGQADTDLPERPDTVAVAGGPPGCTFESLPALVATSDVVVFGTVESAQPGPVIRQEPFPSSDPKVQDDKPTDVLVDVRRREVTVRVEQQFFGAPVESKIILEQAGYEGEQAYELSGTPWLFPGDRAVFFAQENAGTGHYRIMLAGQWVIEQTGTVSTFDTDTHPILAAIDGKPWAAVAANIRTAADDVRAGNASPLNVPYARPGPQRCG